MRLRTIYITEDHKYSSTQINITGDLAKRIKRLAKTIPDEDLTEKGREDKPHVTIKYGLTTGKPDSIAKLLQDTRQFTVTLGKTSSFRSSDEFDVIKIGITSRALRKLNRKIATLRHHNTHPHYKPHITLAYIKPGTAYKYINSEDLLGQSYLVKEIVFSDKNGNHTTIKLKP